MIFKVINEENNFCPAFYFSSILIHDQKMMRNFSLTTLLIIALLLAFQPAVTAQSSRWAYSGGAPHDDYATDLLQSSDGGYVACINGGLADTTSFSVVKLNANGHLLWFTAVDIDAFEEKPYEIIPEQAGDGYVVSGMSGIDQTPVLVRINDEGEIIGSSESWSSDLASNSGLYVKTIPASDTNYAMVCREGDTLHLYLTDDEISGVLLTTVIEFPDVPLSGTLAFTDINATADPYYFIISGNVNPVLPRPFIYVLGSNGLISYEHEFSLGNSLISTVNFSTDNTVIGAGNNADSTQICFFKYDTTGIGTEINLLYPAPGFKVIANDITELSDGTYMILARYFYATGARPVLLNIDADGTLLSENVVMEGAGEINLSDMISAGDDMALCGSVNTETPDKQNEFLIIHSESTLLPLCIYDCVWPGDADNSGLTDMEDLLTIALAYDSVGTVRTDDEPLNYIAHLSEPWSEELPSGINYKYADCNGDGIIDFSDTTALILNYNLSHDIFSLREEGGSEYPLWLNTAGLALHEGYNEIPIMLGTADIPVDDIYGLEFRVSYTNPYIIDSTTVRVKFNDSWLGTADLQLWQLDYNFPLSYNIDAGVTRWDNNNTSGYGEIGRLSFVVEDNIAGMGLADTSLIFYIDGATGIQANGDPVLIGSSAYSILIDGVNNIPNNEAFTIYPNPLQGNKLRIKTSYSLQNAAWRLVDISGRKMCSGIFNGSEIIIPPDIQLSGEYMLIVNFEYGTIICPLVHAGNF